MTIKQFVHEVHVQFKQFELDTPLKRSHVYELIAATFGYNTYASFMYRTLSGKRINNTV